MIFQKREDVSRVAYPQLWLLLPFCAGLCAGRYAYAFFSPLAGTLVALLAACAFVALAVPHKWGRAWRIAPLSAFVVSVFLVGVLSVVAAIGAVRTEWPDGARQYAVRVVSLPRSGARSSSVEAEILRGGYAQRHIRLYLPDSLPVSAGDRLWVYCEIQSPKHTGNPYAFNWADYLLTQGIGGTAYACHIAPMNAREASRPLRLWALHVQEQALNRLSSHFENTDFAMLAAMTLGEKRGLNPQVREVFSQTGTSHLLALSGLHLGILFALYELLVLRVLRRRPLRFAGVGGGIVLVWLYALVAGMPVSLQRAAVMLSLMQVGRLFHSDVLAMDRLLVAALLLLAASPLALFDVGFQLSFVSVASILTFVPQFPTLSEAAPRLVRYLYAHMVVTLCAWVGTMPLVAYYFHTIGVYSVPANLVAVALTGALLSLCLLFFAVPFASAIVVPCIKALLHALTASLRFFADLPGSSVQLFPTLMGAVLGLAALLALAVYVHRRQRGWVIACGIALCALVVEETWAHRPGRTESQVVCYNLWYGSAVQAIRADGCSYLWTHGEGAYNEVNSVAREFWQRGNVEPATRLDSAYSDTYLRLLPPLLSFGGIRVALLCEKQPRVFRPSGCKDSESADTISRPARDSLPQIPVDFILVGRGYSGEPLLSLQRYTGGTVVLDGSLGAGYRRMWLDAAGSLGRKVYDMQQEGALIVPIGKG